MTPLGHKLQHALRVERERMLNEWFFKWHFIGQDGPVEIDGFDGRKIRYGGIRYSGSPRLVYWSTLNRYAQNKVDETFRDLEETTRQYPHEQALAAIDDAERLLAWFLTQVAEDAVEKDRVLRGNGFEFPEPDRSKANSIRISGEIRARATTLRDHIRASKVVDTAVASQSLKDEVLILRPTFWGIGIDLRSLWQRLYGKWRTR
jgi:hypothetical protein